MIPNRAAAVHHSIMFPEIGKRTKFVFREYRERRPIKARCLQDDPDSYSIVSN